MIRGSRGAKSSLRTSFRLRSLVQSLPEPSRKKHRSLCFFAGTPPELWNHFQNLIQNSAKPGPRPKLTAELLSRWMRPHGSKETWRNKKGRSFRQLFELVAFFWVFQENNLETGVYYIDICVFFNVCSKCVKFVPFRKQKPAKRQKFYISRRDRYAV